MTLDVHCSIYITLQYCDLPLLLFLAYSLLSMFIYVTLREVREVEFRIVICRIFGIDDSVTLHCQNVNN